MHISVITNSYYVLWTIIDKHEKGGYKITLKSYEMCKIYSINRIFEGKNSGICILGEN